MHLAFRLFAVVFALTSLGACAAESGALLTWPREVLRFEGAAGVVGSSLSDVWAFEQSPTGPDAFAGLFHWDGGAWSQVPTPTLFVPDPAIGYVNSRVSVFASAGVGSVWAWGMSDARLPLLVVVHADGRVDDHSDELPQITPLFPTVLQAGNGGVFGLFSSASTTRGEELVLLRVDPATGRFVAVVDGLIAARPAARLLAIAGPDEVYLQVARPDPACALTVCDELFVIRRYHAGVWTDVSTLTTDTSGAAAFGDDLFTFQSTTTSPDELTGAGFHVDATTMTPFVATGWPVHASAVYPLVLEDGSFGVLAHDALSTVLVHLDATGHVTGTSIASNHPPSLTYGSAGMVHLTDGTLLETYGAPDSGHSLWAYYDVGAR
jgi:hypothetical protein